MAQAQTPSPLSGTRRRLLNLLKVGGPSTVTELAEQLGISGMAVRSHLSALELEGTVTYEVQKRPQGRPAKVYDLTAAAERHFPEGYRDLSLDLLDAAEAEWGDGAVAAVLGRWADAQAEAMAADLPAGGGLDKRVRDLAALRDAAGCMAEVEREDGGGLLLIEYHCPVLAVAERHPAFVEAETRALARALGTGPSQPRVECLEHLGRGDQRTCRRIR